jgi:hypothetical protein
MNGNIVGEPFDKFVRDQIGVRQSNQFSGYNTLRTDDQLKYLTNRNAWVKLASSVNILADTTLTPPSNIIPGSNPTGITSPTLAALAPLQVQEGRTIKLGESKLKNIGFGESEAKNYLGTKLAEKAILFNTLSSFDPIKKAYSPHRAGISNTTDLWNNFAYGLGGTDFGIQPPPGILGVTVDSLNRGSIRKANITLKAHNKFQFDTIELLYLRLGFTMMLEWGWDKYLDNNGVLQQTGNTIIEEEWFTTNGVSQLEMLAKIQQKRSNYLGNYDGFFGKVSNFTWSFNPDGSYDISIDLITIGDVIESLKVNTSVKEKFYPDKPFEEIKFEEGSKLFNTNIAKVSSLNTIGYFLYKRIESLTNNFTYNINDSSNDLRRSLIAQDYIAFSTKNDTSYKSPQYYIRLGEFFSQLENLVIPKIQNNGINSTSQIMFEKVGCLISYFPNQIPLDPRVCLFKPSLNTYGDITGITDPSYFNVIPSPYLTTINNRTYGLLTNLYINFEFIAGLLAANGGPDQELYLFKFLQDLCNGINNALGGVNKLEPIIKDDYYITIIDQTLSIPEEENVILEIYGYNKDKNNQTSNFVKDIKFVSKITPQLASMVTIGATAAGGTTSELDGTAFTKFSNGLEDRFSKEVLEPDGLFQLKQKEEEQAEKIEEDYKTKFLSFKRAYEGNIIQQTGEFLTEIFTSTASGLANLRLGVNRIFGTENRTDNFYNRSAVDAAGEFENLDNDLKEKRIVVDLRAGFESVNGVPMSFDEYKIRMPELERKARIDKNYDENELNQLVSENYAVYLTNAFGGVQDDIKITYQNYINRVSGTGATVTGRDYLNSTTTKSLEITSGRSRYLEFDDVFISQGKSAYKVYINNLNNVIYKTSGSPSSEIGFIPLSFELVLDGISGIKIYQKLNINNKFLPSNYPESLKFIITKVNHQISNNSWDTSLSTISIPVTEPYPTQLPPPENTGNTENTNSTGNASNTITGILTPQPGQSGKFEPLKSIAAKYESGGKGYGASNTGTVQGCQFSNVTNVENMEFRELRRRMQLPSSPCDRNRVFAVGKYQIIPLTLFGGGNLTGGLWKQLGLKDTDKYTPDIQEKMFIQMLLNRTPLGNYLTAKNQGTLAQLSDAIQQLSQLFASMPTIKDQNGNIVGNVELGTGNAPYYSGALNNKPKAVSIRQMAKIMVQTRINYSGAVPNYIPSYYTSPV